MRVGAHSTSDDPSVYRPPDEAENFPLGDPVQRMRQHLEVIGEWDPPRHEALQEEIDAQIAEAFTEADSHGSVKTGDVGSARTMFDDVYAEMPRHLREQREKMGDPS
jgi:2-oxoisovalerate dehydrogenase E1 component alpha subunit